MKENKVIIYTANDGSTKIDVKLEEETLWLTQAQMCELYQTSKSNVSEHIKHIFEDCELCEESVVRKFRTTAADISEESYEDGKYELVLTAVKNTTGKSRTLYVGVMDMNHQDSMEVTQK